jgi:hypothetical protein
MLRIEGEQSMKIQIIGPRADPVFRDLETVVLRAIHELGVEATLDEVTTLEEIQKMPMAVYPALVIDGRLICQGHTITLERAKECILEITKGSSSS